MSSSTTNDTPSPFTKSSPLAQNGATEIPDSQEESPRRRPSFEKLDPAEVTKALQIAELLKKPSSTTVQKPKIETNIPKKPSPPPSAAAEFIPRPPPIPFSGTTNPDAIALRATTDILQMQKARATENIQRLEELKALNRKDPKEFLKQLVAGNLKSGTGEKDGILGPTVGPNVEKLLAALDVGSTKGASEGNDAKAGAERNGDNMDTDEKSSTPDVAEQDGQHQYPRFPAPQNIVRTPAINWAKYGIVGDTLDKMHEEQRTNPSLSEPDRLSSRGSQPTTPVVGPMQEPEPKAPRFVMAAPYDPLKDQVKKGARKPY